MRKYLAAAGAALMISAAGLSYAQTPPGTDRPKGETSQTSADPKMDRGGMRSTTKKATSKKATSKKATTKKAKKTRTARVKREPAQKEPQRDNWWNWGDDKRGTKR